MPKKNLPKRTFGVGEIDPEFLMRRDTEQYRDGAKTFRNARILNSGAFTRRPGSEWLATLMGNSLLVGFYFNDNQEYVLAFSNGRMDAYLSDGTAAGSVTSAPWTTAILNALRFEVEGDTVFVFHQDMETQVITRTGASTWSLADYAFSAGFGSTINQPYYKFADPSITLTPSATTGSIDLVASADLFDSGHVDTRFRYLEREIQITAVTDAQNATATVIETLPAAQRLTVTSSAFFQVGHIVEHDTTTIQAKIFNIPDGTHVDVIPVDRTDSIPGSGNIVGPDGKTAVSGIASVSLPALTDWDEQVASGVRGYFGTGKLHRNRFVFMDHPLIPDAFIASVIGQYYNFDLGDGGDADAIFEFIGDGTVTRVRGLVSDENLIILTNNRPYYVAERTGFPITPDDISIRPFGRSGAGTAQGGAFAGGIVYPDASGKRVTRINPTGNQENPWTAIDVSLLSSHLINSPVDAAYCDKFSDRAERYAFFVNTNGTLAVHHNIEDQNVNGFGLWETDGNYKSVCVVNNKVFACVQRTVNGNTVYTLELFDTDLRVDAAKEFASSPGTISDYAGETVRVTGSTYDFGDKAVSAGGVVTVSTNFEGPFQAGFFFAPSVSVLPWEILSDESMAGKKKRYTEINVHIKDSGRFKVNSKNTTAYRGGDDLTQPPPVRTEIKHFSDLGRAYEPPIDITQEDCVPLTVLGLTAEVSF